MSLAAWRSVPFRSMVAAAVMALASTGLLAHPSAVAADTGDIGWEDQSYVGTSEPTGTKRSESLLWWNDGSWWANMWDTATSDFHIFRLNVATQAWVDTGTLTDGRANSHADVLWSGGHLYVASHLTINDELPAVAGFPSYLYRFSYNPTTKTYSLDSGFPVLINNYKTETLVIDRDSTGKLWATWQQDNKIYVNRTINGDDHTWGTPFQLPVAATDVTVDDNSAVIAFGGDKIGVMWGNQTSSNDAMWFAVHVDGQPDTSWQAARTAIQGPNTADDHMNLKSLQSDSSGRVYAAIKTSFTSSAQPLIMLLVRDPASGDWTSYPISRVSDCPNRVIVLIDEQNGILHAFFSAPAPPALACNSSGGAIYEKTSPLDAIAFPTGAGTPVILDYGTVKMHNATSTKQNVNSQTGIVVLARNNDTDRYWHHYAALPGSPPPSPPTANFTGSPTSGTAPLSVSFTDSSTGGPTSWSWSFGDGGTSTQQHPNHTYQSSGTYTVTLTASNAGGPDTLTRTNYITVNPSGPPPPTANFTGTPTSGTAPLAVAFTDSSTGSPTSWSWTFGDGGTSTLQNPSHTYQSAGTYTVALTATNAGGSDTLTRTNYVTVNPSGPPPPTANFTGSPTSGTAPLTVGFTDSSTGSPTSWSWTFGDGGTSTLQNPSHTYQSAGTYTVTLTASNAGGSDTLTRTNYITVSAAADFSLSVAPSKVIVVRGSPATYTVTVSSLNGFSGTVQLTVSGLPAGTSGSFAPISITVPPTGTSVLTVTTSSTMKAGTYTLTITGTSGSLSHATTVTLQVKRK